MARRRVGKVNGREVGVFLEGVKVMLREQPTAAWVSLGISVLVYLACVIGRRVVASVRAVGKRGRR